MARITKQLISDKVIVNDDLTAIKGIRAARQQWFRDVMNVHTYDDLAGLSVNGIVLGLKAEKQIPSRTMIEAWISQAKILAETTNKQLQIPNVKASSDIVQWKPIASFVLEYQVLENPNGSNQYRTTAHHIETDKNQLWSGIEQTECVRWMLAEAGIESQDTTPRLEPKGVVSPTTPNYPIQFSEKLQRILAKTAKITGTPLPPQTPTVAEKPLPKSKDNPPQYSGFSEKMQQILAKTQKMTTKAG